MNNPDIATRAGLDRVHRDSFTDVDAIPPAAIAADPVPLGEDAGAPSIEEKCADLDAYDLCAPEEQASATLTSATIESPGDAVPIEEAPDGAVTAGGSADLDARAARRELRGWPRFEAWVERLAHKYKFIRKITSRLYLPIAFHSGLTMKKLDPHTFTYVLPFRRFNRNFYDAMAGAALVANSEIAAGMYLFGELGGKWTVVCKRISYRFLRPCLGPAIYKVNPLEDVRAKIQAGIEFNIDLTLEILQQVTGRRTHPRVGRCEVTFHCAPKGPEGNRGLRRRRRRRLLK